MTTDLKTLKDIEFDKGDNQSGYLPMCYTEELREDAIKWIKDLERQIEHVPFCTPMLAEAQITWIKHFFNINDEDLK